MERKYQLLIVDDDPDFLTHYREYFAQRGFLVDVAQDGLDGLEKLRHGEFDVALVDLKLPNMDGLEMIRQAHQAGIDADMIILSGAGESNKACLWKRLHGSYRLFQNRNSNGNSKSILRTRDFSQSMARTRGFSRKRSASPQDGMD